MHMAKQQEKELTGMDAIWTQGIPQRNVRHYRMSKQSKVRHCQVMREKVVEVPERLKVDDSNDPLAGDDAEQIISRRMAEGVNNRQGIGWLCYCPIAAHASLASGRGDFPQP